MCRLLFLLGLQVAAVAVAQPPPGEPPQKPFLRIQAGAHATPVAQLATDAAEGLLGSLSDDKTLRLWNLPEVTQRLVIRPPVGLGEDGELYVVALNPDGTRVAAAGFTGREWDGVFCLDLHDTRSGQLLARLSGLAAPVQHLAFSADGMRLPKAMGSRAGVKV